jgi:hypothetical protein
MHLVQRHRRTRAKEILVECARLSDDACDKNVDVARDGGFDGASAEILIGPGNQSQGREAILSVGGDEQPSSMNV